MTDPYWCPHCAEHHPVRSMVEWCNQKRPGGAAQYQTQGAHQT